MEQQLKEEFSKRIQHLHKLNEEKKELEENQEKVKQRLKEIEDEINPLKDELLFNMTENELTELEDGDLIAVIDCKTTKGYSKEEEKKILDILKNKKLMHCISIKESLAKNELKNELKSNESLQKELEGFGKEKKTRYVMVMTKENNEKRKEHIEESLGKKNA